jgi:hypothetical protein
MNMDEEPQLLPLQQPQHLPTHQLRTIEQAVTVGTRLPISWFRGHDKTYGNLTPSVYREKPAARGDYREYFLAERFRLRAGSIHDRVPNWNDHLRRLLLMQHHGLPTRLLDWSESILVALYFAVQGSHDEPGEIWCIRPDALNNLSGYHLHSADRPVVRYLAAEPFTDRDKLDALADELKVSHSFLKNPNAFLPPMEFPRMSAQSSRFTIHPRPHPAGGNTIESLLSGPRQIIRYDVPAASKSTLCRDLTALGVTAETLFRSLDTLSCTIKAEVYADDRGEKYPDPPVFE